MKRNLKKPKPKETEDDDHLRISDNNTTISNRKVVSTEETASNWGSSATSKVSKDVAAGFSLMDPFTLGFSGGDYFPADPMEVTYNWGICANNGVWDPSWLDFDFSSTLFTDDWTVSGYNPLLGATDFFNASTFQTSSADINNSLSITEAN
ncbi:hypothetical protein ISN44_As01g049060 [Arabidopsis suecica]|uniref:Uncharacterized protein n=1 Tax=Arabidopsis suecica TaxID=45249 RepID=A0A8T2HC64_ARASU|nr:hypothetical protein ISN44_As01g049060 [Arabidopsis suecica]